MHKSSHQWSSGFINLSIYCTQNLKRYRLRLAMGNGRLWKAMRQMRAVDASMDLPALMFRCKQSESAVDTPGPRAYRYCMTGCEHLNVIAGAVVGMVFTAKQPILWGCCYARSGD